ncbi:MAG: hypothetical protein JNK65_04170 [Deltaproteobacteria bacterium]|nr:hypothetical protein [Deltaproteobacteria bacterium]
MKKLFLFIFVLSLFSSQKLFAAWGEIDFKFDCSQNAKVSKEIVLACIHEKIFPERSLTYFDALRLIYPDLKPDGSATYFSRSLRKNFGFNGEGDPLPISPGGPLFNVGSQSFLSLKGSPSKILILDRQSGILAYIQIDPVPKLLDLLGVSQDINVTLLSEIVPIEVKSGHWLFATLSSHHNSGESFKIYNLFITFSDRLDLVYDGPHLYSFLFPKDPDCWTQQNYSSLIPSKTQSNGMLDLQMKVQEAKVCLKNQKETSSAVKIFEAILKWDGAKYMGGSKPLYLLNRSRMN